MNSVMIDISSLVVTCQRSRRRQSSTMPTGQSSTEASTVQSV